MGKHTPGPWEWDWRQIDGEADCGVRWMKREGHAYSVCRAPRYQSQEQWEADARLIAAAPDLLSALIAMEAKASKQNWNDAYPDQLEAARAAIAKATGEQQ